MENSSHVFFQNFQLCDASGAWGASGAGEENPTISLINFLLFDFKTAVFNVDAVGNSLAISQ